MYRWRRRSAGDLNGDGFADLVIGAHGTISTMNSHGYVVFGHGGPFAADLDLGTLDGSNGFRIDSGPGYGLGWSVSGAGDVNGDGFDDVIWRQ